LAQSVPVTAGIVVTTPQQVSLDDSKRSLNMFEKFHIPIAGVVENMSGFICPSCETESDIFGMGTADTIAKEYNTTLMAQVPIEPAIRNGGDTGQPITFFQPDSQTAKRYHTAATSLLAFIDKVNAEGGVDNAAMQPTTPPGVSACSTGGTAAAAAAAKAAPKTDSGESCGTGCGCH
jgi:ATP-binding protein involved in chromosome partitioning